MSLDTNLSVEASSVQGEPKQSLENVLRDSISFEKNKILFLRNIWNPLFRNVPTLRSMSTLKDLNFQKNPTLYGNIRWQISKVIFVTFLILFVSKHTFNTKQETSSVITEKEKNAYETEQKEMELFLDQLEEYLASKGTSNPELEKFLKNLRKKRTSSN